MTKPASRSVATRVAMGDAAGAKVTGDRLGEARLRSDALLALDRR
jgi:hypothetical protein